MIQKLTMAIRLLRSQGMLKFVEIVYRRAKLKLALYNRGSNRTVILDGCRFDLRNLPDTSMKLELLTGTYEQPERSAALRYIRPEWPVVELGGCIGVVACITNKMLSNKAHHVVLEANPNVIEHLEANRDANGCSFKILNSALAYESETVTFSPARDFWGNSLYSNKSQQPSVTVPATQLGRIVQEAHFDTFALICDIEGQEYQLVMREVETLRKAELIIMEVHPHMIGEEKVLSLLEKLTELGFKTIERSTLVVVLGKTE